MVGKDPNTAGGKIEQDQQLCYRQGKEESLLDGADIVAGSSHIVSRLGDD